MVSQISQLISTELRAWINNDIIFVYLLRAIRGFDPSSSGKPTWPTRNWVPGPHTSLWIGFLSLSGLILSQEFSPTSGIVLLLIFAFFYSSSSCLFLLSSARRVEIVIQKLPLRDQCCHYMQIILRTISNPTTKIIRLVRSIFFNLVRSSRFFFSKFRFPTLSRYSSRSIVIRLTRSTRL